MTAGTSSPATAPAPDAPEQPVGVGRAALIGVVAVAVTVGVAEMFSALLVWWNLLGGSSSPVASLGGAMIDISPSWLVEWAKNTLGSPGDKIVLGVGIGVVMALAGAATGLLGRARYAYSVVAALLLVVVAAAAIESRADAGLADLLPLLLGVGAGIWLLAAAFSPEGHRTAAPVPAAERRRFLQLAGYGALGAVIAGALSRLIPTGTAEASRATVELVPVADQAEGSVSTLDGVVPGITPYVTANADFYRIDTAFVLPQLAAQDWSLRIHGMVDRPITIGWDELQQMPMIERMITLTCVSNPRGGDLVGNARWQGTRIADVLAKAGPQAGADCVLTSDVKGFTVSTPLEALTDARDALLAVGMNGEPLPVEHGFPVRMVVPGLYGFVSATKWVVDMRVTRFADVMAYWTGLGWSDHGPIKTSSRIDVPIETVGAGMVPIAGVAWAQHRGVHAVQVQMDGGSGWGPWRNAELSRPVSIDTWVQWVYRWDAEPGSYRVRCRAIDDTGTPQIGKDSDVLPDGATGYHQVTIDVRG